MRFRYFFFRFGVSFSKSADLKQKENEGGKTSALAPPKKKTPGGGRKLPPGAILSGRDRAHVLPPWGVLL